MMKRLPENDLQHYFNEEIWQGVVWESRKTKYIEFVCAKSLKNIAAPVRHLVSQNNNNFLKEYPYSKLNNCQQYLSHY